MCKDGVRTKAAYLQDTPAEALTQELGTRGRPPVSNSHNFLSRQHLPEAPDAAPRHPYGRPSPYIPYSAAGQNPLPSTPLSVDPQSFGNHRAVLPPIYSATPGQSSLQMQNYGSVLHGNPPSSSDPVRNGYEFAPFELSYLDDLNFDNRFAAAEFGMLGTMTSGLAHSPPSDGTGGFQPGAGSFTPNTASRSFAQSPVDLQQYPYQPTQATPQWSADVQQKTNLESDASHFAGRTMDALDTNIKQEPQPAFVIGSSAYPSPSSGSSPQASGDTYTDIGPQHRAPPRQETSSHRQPKASTTSASVTTTPFPKDQTLPSHRYRNPSEVSNSVNQLYSSTAGFPRLTALIQGRFSPQKTARIAKALAAIRPSFISCTMKLSRDGRTFMEKCRQRTHWGLEEIIRATGLEKSSLWEKNFRILTGWSKDVLLGKAPNLDVNRDSDTSAFPGTGHIFARRRPPASRTGPTTYGSGEHCELIG
ncbi:MAG: hypothetical protein Q9163_006486 [Psora crenata]